MEKRDDLRIIKTRRAIEQAFFRLLQQMDFETITVRKLCDEAMVGNATFYYHYQDKCDLAEQVGRRCIQEIRAGIHAHRDDVKRRAAGIRAVDHMTELTGERNRQRALLEKVHLEHYDFASELNRLFLEEVKAVRPQGDLSDEVYQLRCRICAGMMKDYLNVVLERDAFLSFEDYMHEAAALLEEYRSVFSGG